MEPYSQYNRPNVFLNILHWPWQASEYWCPERFLRWMWHCWNDDGRTLAV